MAETDETETEGEGERYEFGQECLDRLALAVGGNTLAPLAAPALGRLLISPEWRSRHAALICLAQIAEGCAKVLLKQIKGLVDMCMKVRPAPAQVCQAQKVFRGRGVSVEPHDTR